MCHPNFRDSDSFLQQFRQTAEDKIEASAWNTLPFPVQHHIGKHNNLTWIDDDFKIVYIDLKAHDDECSVMRDKHSFEICWIKNNYL